MHLQCTASNFCPPISQADGARKQSGGEKGSTHLHLFVSNTLPRSSQNDGINKQAPGNVVWATAEDPRQLKEMVATSATNNNFMRLSFRKTA